MNPNTLTPVTCDDRNFFHDEGSNGFLGDFVETVHGVGYKGRIYNCHFGCPESEEWLARQNFLGGNPTKWKRCRWVSILVHGGGAIVVPEQMVRVIEPFLLDNNSSGLYFSLSERACSLYWPSITSGGMDDEQCPNEATTVRDDMSLCAECARYMDKYFPRPGDLPQTQEAETEN